MNSPWGCKEFDRTERLSIFTSFNIQVEVNFMQEMYRTDINLGAIIMQMVKAIKL